METVLKYDRIILTKELNEKFNQVGEVFEIASILNNSFMLRDARSKIALGVVSFDDFDRCFVKQDEASGWTPWTQFIGIDGQTDAFYRTNFKKVQVRFLTDKVRAESSCNLKFNDEFNLFFGLQIAYLRCCNKALLKRKRELEAEFETELKRIVCETTDNNKIMEKMINSLEG